MKNAIKKVLAIALCLTVMATGSSVSFASGFGAPDESKALNVGGGLKAQLDTEDLKRVPASLDGSANLSSLPDKRNISSKRILPPAIGQTNQSEFTLLDFSGPYPLDYYATEGDWTTVLYSIWPEYYNREITGTVDLVPANGGWEDTITLNVYPIGDNSGILFMDNTPAGEYHIYMNSYLLDRNLKVLGRDEKYVINISQSFEGSWNYYSPYYDSWTYNSLYNNVFPIYGNAYYSGTPYFPGPDNKYYFNLFSKNLRPSDIISAEIKNGAGVVFASGKAIPGNSDYKDCEMILVFDPQMSNLTPPDEAVLTIKFKPDVHGSFIGDTLTEELYYFDLDTYAYADTTNIDQLKVDLVFPENIGSSLSIQLRYMDAKGDKVNSRISASSNTGRYTFTLPQNVDLFNTDGYFLLIRDPVPGLLADVIPISYGKSVPVYTEDIYPTDLNGHSFLVNPEYIAGISRENAVFTLSNSNFTPVNGVSIKKDNNPEYNLYEFSANNTLPVGDYYIMFGKLPVKKIHLSNTSTNPPSNGLFISSSYDIHESSAFVLLISDELLLGEWKVVLENQMDGNVVVLNTSDGSLLWSAEEEMFYNDEKIIPPGIYSKKFFRNNNQIVENDTISIYNADYLVVSPDESSPTIKEAWTSLNFGKVNSAFGVSGFTTPDATVSGLRVETYKMTIPFLNPQSLGTTNLQTVNAYENGYFETSVGVKDLNISDPGMYWFVVTDQTGKILFTSANYFTQTSLSVYSSISGTVTLGNQPKVANVELWNGNTKIDATTSGADGKFSFENLLSGIKYTVKIAASSSWQAFSQDITLTESAYNLPIALKAPVGGGIIIGGGGGSSSSGGGGGGSSTTTPPAPVATSPAVTTPTTASSITTDTSSAAAPVTSVLASYRDNSLIASWAVPFFEQLIKGGIISGRDDGALDPKGNVTRAEFTKMIVLALDIKPSTEVLNFSDVKDGSWYKEFVDRASSNGIILGVSESEFSPNANITRQDLCAIVYRALSYANITLPETEALNFSDTDTVGDYAKDAVALLKQLSIVSGRDDGRFDPKAFATREETAKIICGVLDYLKLK